MVFNCDLLTFYWVKKTENTKGVHKEKKSKYDTNRNE